MDWASLNDQADIAALMQLADDFHDACLRECHVWTGAYVDASGGYLVQPEDWDVSARVFLQCRTVPAVELRFRKVINLHVAAVPPLHGHEIAAVTFLVRDGRFYWADVDGWNPGEAPSPLEFTWLVAHEAAWRIRGNWLGPELRYGSGD